MSDCCGDYYAEATITGASFASVKKALKLLIDPKNDSDVVEKKDDGSVHVIAYQAGHDQYISEAYDLKEEMEAALSTMKDTRPKMTYDVNLYVYKYEWIPVF